MLASLKAQNNALHVTTEKLVSTNSELMERVNKQSEQVAALEDALSRAQTTQFHGTGAPQPSPGVRSPFGKHLLECLASLQSAVPGTAALPWYPYIVFGRMAAATLHSNTCSLYQAEPPSDSGMPASGGVRITETELELMALAEYVQELEGKVAKLQARATGQQEAAASPKGSLCSTIFQPIRVFIAG